MGNCLATPFKAARSRNRSGYEKLTSSSPRSMPFNHRQKIKDMYKAPENPRIVVPSTIPYAPVDVFTHACDLYPVEHYIRDGGKREDYYEGRFLDEYIRRHGRHPLLDEEVLVVPGGNGPALMMYDDRER